MRAVPGVAAAVALLAVVVAIVAIAVHGRSSPKPVATGPPITVLRADQTLVTGTVTAAEVQDAVADPLPMPVTITIPVRGHGELNIDHVSVNGRPGTVSWDGGQPLPIAGSGDLDLGPATLDLGGGANGDGMIWHLDGMAREFTSGTFTAESSVAVGNAGLAEPLDEASFQVPAGAEAPMVTVGDAQIHLSPRPVALRGPGTAVLTGSLTIQTSSGTRTVHSVRFGGGPFDLAFTPQAGGYAVDGLLQGAVTAS